MCGLETATAEEEERKSETSAAVMNFMTVKGDLISVRRVGMGASESGLMWGDEEIIYLTSEGETRCPRVEERQKQGLFYETRRVSTKESMERASREEEARSK